MLTLDKILEKLRQEKEHAEGVVSRTRCPIQSAQYQGERNGYAHALKLLEEFKGQRQS